MSSFIKRALFGGKSAKGRGPGEQPNVLLVSLDTLRFDCVGAMDERRFLGDLTDRVSTPRLDGLAARGAVFTSCISAAPFTTPSHASLFTGLWLPQHGAFHQYKTPVAAQSVTLAERLLANGYRTAQSAGRASGEGVMFASEVTGLKRGFEASIFAGSVSKSAVKWLQKAKGRPWHLFFHTFAAHWPYGRSAAECERMFAEAWEHDDWTAVREMYVENARDVDSIAGELLDLLDSSGELENTIVVVLSDHGEGLHHAAPLHGPINGGREEVIRVPLILVAPWAVLPGTRVTSQVRTVDILPTIAELAGIPPTTEPIPLVGESLVPLLTAAVEPADRPAYFAGHLNDDTLESPLLSGVRTGRWKLLLDDCTAERVDLFERRLARQDGAALKADLRGKLLREMLAANEPVKLYDLVNDPRETRNVASEHPELAASLKAQVDSWRANSNAAGPSGSEDSELEEQLRALGYLT